MDVVVPSRPFNYLSLDNDNPVMVALSRVVSQTPKSGPNGFSGAFDIGVSDLICDAKPSSVFRYLRSFVYKNLPLLILSLIVPVST